MRMTATRDSAGTGAHAVQFAEHILNKYVTGASPQPRYSGLVHYDRRRQAAPEGSTDIHLYHHMRLTLQLLLKQLPTAQAQPRQRILAKDIQLIQDRQPQPEQKPAPSGSKRHGHEVRPEARPDVRPEIRDVRQNVKREVRQVVAKEAAKKAAEEAAKKAAEEAEAVGKRGTQPARDRTDPLAARTAKGLQPLQKREGQQKREQQEHELQHEQQELLQAGRYRAIVKDIHMRLRAQMETQYRHLSFLHSKEQHISRPSRSLPIRQKDMRPSARTETRAGIKNISDLEPVRATVTATATVPGPARAVQSLLQRLAARQDKGAWEAAWTDLKLTQAKMMRLSSDEGGGQSVTKAAAARAAGQHAAVVQAAGRPAAVARTAGTEAAVARATGMEAASQRATATTGMGAVVARATGRWAVTEHAAAKQASNARAEMVQFAPKQTGTVRFMPVQAAGALAASRQDEGKGPSEQAFSAQRKEVGKGQESARNAPAAQPPVEGELTVRSNSQGLPATAAQRHISLSRMKRKFATPLQARGSRTTALKSGTEEHNQFPSQAEKDSASLPLTVQFSLASTFGNRLFTGENFVQRLRSGRELPGRSLNASRLQSAQDRLQPYSTLVLRNTLVTSDSSSGLKRATRQLVTQRNVQSSSLIQQPNGKRTTSVQASDGGRHSGDKDRRLNEERSPEGLAAQALRAEVRNVWRHVDLIQRLSSVQGGAVSAAAKGDADSGYTSKQGVKEHSVIQLQFTRAVFQAHLPPARTSVIVTQLQTDKGAFSPTAGRLHSKSYLNRIKKGNLNVNALYSRLQSGSSRLISLLQRQTTLQRLSQHRTNRPKRELLASERGVREVPGELVARRGAGEAAARTKRGASADTAAAKRAVAQRVAAERGVRGELVVRRGAGEAAVTTKRAASAETAAAKRAVAQRVAAERGVRGELVVRRGAGEAAVTTKRGGSADTAATKRAVAQRVAAERGVRGELVVRRGAGEAAARTKRGASADTAATKRAVAQRVAAERGVRGELVVRRGAGEAAVTTKRAASADTATTKRAASAETVAAQRAVAQRVAAERGVRGELVERRGAGEAAVTTKRAASADTAAAQQRAVAQRVAALSRPVQLQLKNEQRSVQSESQPRIHPAAQPPSPPFQPLQTAAGSLSQSVPQSQGNAAASQSQGNATATASYPQTATGRRATMQFKRSALPAARRNPPFSPFRQPAQLAERSTRMQHLAQVRMQAARQMAGKGPAPFPMVKIAIARAAIAHSPMVKSAIGEAAQFTPPAMNSVAMNGTTQMRFASQALPLTHAAVEAGGQAGSGLDGSLAVAGSLSAVHRRSGPAVAAGQAVIEARKGASPAALQHFQSRPAPSAAPQTTVIQQQPLPTFDERELQQMVMRMPQLQTDVLVDKVYKALERKFKFEQRRRGL